MNKNALKAKMVLHGDTGAILAEALGISRQQFSAKLNETKGAEFTQGEIRIIKNRYSLTCDEVDYIFSREVSFLDTSIEGGAYMIDKYTILGVKFFVPVCDLCDKELQQERDFEDAVAAICGEGWVTKKTREGWANYCPECAAMMNSARRDFDD